MTIYSSEVTVYSTCVLGVQYLHILRTGVVVTMYSSCVLGIQLLFVF